MYYFVLLVPAKSQHFPSKKHQLHYSLLGRLILDRSMSLLRSFTDSKIITQHLSPELSSLSTELVGLLSSLSQSDEKVIFVRGDRPLIRRQTLEHVLRLEHNLVYLGDEAECPAAQLQKHLDRKLHYQALPQDQSLIIQKTADLSLAAQSLSQWRIKELQEQGVIFWLPETALISPDSQIAPGTEIGPNCQLIGKVQVAKDCQINNSYLENCCIGEETQIRASHITDSKIGRKCSIGPFAQLRGNCSVADEASIGNFVEMKNTSLGTASKASHLSYLGDASIGCDVNIGAGTITANFDAITGQKHRITIEDQAKIGSNTVLIAPLRIAMGCMIGAGSTITQSVDSPHSLSLARPTQQITKVNWVQKKSQLSDHTSTTTNDSKQVD